VVISLIFLLFNLRKKKKIFSFEDEAMSDSDMSSMKSEVVKNKLISKLKAEAGKTPTSSAKVKIFIETFFIKFNSEN
jgi:hypothetical protein